MQTTFFRPIKSNNLTQRFGENSVCAKTQPGGFPIRPYVLVNKSGLTCPAGYKDFYRLIGMKGHNGGDWASWHGEPVYHCGLYAGWMQTSHDKDGGLNVDIVSKEAIFPCTENGCLAGTMHYILTRYAHGEKAIGFEKKEINPGDNIMLADNTGDSSGDHVHWSPKWCDANGVGIHMDNGYQGAFDYDPFFENIFILDYIAAQQKKAAALPTTIHPSIADIPTPVPVPLSTTDLIRKAIFAIVTYLQKLSTPR